MNKNYSVLYSYFLKHKVKITFLLLFAIINAFMMVSISLIIGSLMEYASSGMIYGFKIGFKLVSLFLVIYIALTLLSYLFIYNLSNKMILMQKYNLEMSIVNNFSRKNYVSSEILNLFNNDINLICEKYYKSIFEIIRSIFFVLSTVILSATISIYLFFLVLILFAIPIIIQLMLKKRIIKSREEYQKTRINFNLYIISFIKSKLTVRCFDKSNYTKNDAKLVINNKAQAEKSLAQQVLLTDRTISLVPSIASVTSVIICAYLLGLGRIEYTNAIAFVFIIGYALWELVKILRLKTQIDSTQPIRENFIKIATYEKEEIEEKQKYINNYIKFNDVSVKFDDNYALKDVNLNFEIGKKYLILGESGSGKSTLIKAMLSLINYSGNIIFRGINIKNIDKKLLYRNIGYVVQQGEFIPDTIEKNISLSNNSDINKVISSLEKAKFNFNNGNNIEKLVDIENTNISGGELQRISLARTLYHDKSILILDEFTSALHIDMANDIEKLLLNLKDKTIINISHRTFEQEIELYDEIVVMDKSQVIFKGKYSENTSLVDKYIVKQSEVSC